MKRLSGLAALPLIAGAALAEPLPFDGRWGWNVEACAYEPGESDMVPTVIANGEILYYESLCTIESVEPIGGEGDEAVRTEEGCGGDDARRDHRGQTAAGGHFLAAAPASCCCCCCKYCATIFERSIAYCFT